MFDSIRKVSKLLKEKEKEEEITDEYIIKISYSKKDLELLENYLGNYGIIHSRCIDDVIFLAEDLNIEEKDLKELKAYKTNLFIKGFEKEEYTIDNVKDITNFMINYNIYHIDIDEHKYAKLIGTKYNTVAHYYGNLVMKFIEQLFVTNNFKLIMDVYNNFNFDARDFTNKLISKNLKGIYGERYANVENNKDFKNMYIFFKKKYDELNYKKYNYNNY